MNKVLRYGPVVGMSVLCITNVALTFAMNDFHIQPWTWVLLGAGTLATAGIAILGGKLDA